MIQSINFMDLKWEKEKSKLETAASDVVIRSRAL